VFGPFVSLSVSLCIPNFVNAIILKSSGRVFAKLSIFVRFEIRMDVQVLGVERSKFQVAVRSNMLENALFYLVSAKIT